MNFCIAPCGTFLMSIIDLLIVMQYASSGSINIVQYASSGSLLVNMPLSGLINATASSFWLKNAFFWLSLIHRASLARIQVYCPSMLHSLVRRKGGTAKNGAWGWRSYWDKGYWIQDRFNPSPLHYFLWVKVGWSPGM